MSPAAPMSWMPTIASVRHRLEAGLDQTLLGEGIAHLHGRALGLAGLVELGGSQQAGAVDAVAPGLAPDVEHRVAEAGGLGEEEPVLAHQAQVEGVHHDVAAVALVEAGLAADGGDADRVAVAADPLAPRRAAGSGASGSSSGPKRSESSDAIGRAPIVKMSRRMPPTPVAAPCRGSMNEGWLWLSILKTTARPSPIETQPAFSPGPWSTCSAARGEPPQVLLARLVGAVLGPHHREDPELGIARLAAEDRRGCSATPRA